MSQMLKNLMWVLGGLAVGVGLMALWVLIINPKINKANQPISSQTALLKASPQPSPTFIFNPAKPPKESVVGKILSLSGEVNWQDRLATEPAEIKSPREVLQGEEVETGKTGKVVLEFPEFVKMIILPKSKLEFAQTLPLNFVINQSLGSVEYTTYKKDLSIRIKRLLVDKIDTGKLTVSLDEEEGIITAYSEEGTASAAYNSKEFDTQVVEIAEGERFIFDNDNRTGRLR